jgi:hypothetical protein
MKGLVGESSVPQARIVNAVALPNAVLCAECDVVSDSPHDICLVCGSHSLFNIARMFGGNLPKVRARLVVDQLVETQSRQVVLTFPKPHRPRRRATVGSRQALSFNGDKGDEINCGVLLGPQSR